MSKKIVVGTSRQALARQTFQLKKITELMLASALLSFATVSVNAQALANATVVTQDTTLTGHINGALSGGGQAAGYVITDGAALTIGANGSQSLVSNFNTVGGAGSGGGAGLGGAFFVDAGSTLTVLNTNFASNRAQGGTGGGATPLSYLDQLLNVTGATVSLTAMPVTTASVVESGGLPLMTRNVNGTNGAVSYSFDRLSVSSDVASLLKSGTMAAFDNYGASVAIDSITSTTVALTASVTASAKSLVTYVPTTIVTDVVTSIPAITAAGQSGYAFVNGTVQLSYAYTLTQFVNNSTSPATTTYGKAAVDIADLSSVNVGDKLVTGTNTSQIATITDVVRYTSAEDTAQGAGGTLTGKVKSFTLDKSITGTPSYVDVIKAPSFKAVQFTSAGSNVTIAGTSTLVTGMTVTWTENNTAKSAVVQNVLGRTVTLANGASVGAGVTDLKLVENPLVADNAIRVTNASSKFSRNQIVYVPGSNGTVYQGTVDQVVDNVVYVIPATAGTKLSDYYDPSLGLALKTAAASVNGSAITVPFSAGTKTDVQVLALLAGRTVSGGSFNDGTTVNAVTLNKSVVNGRTVITSVTLGLSQAPTSSVVENFRLLSPISYGGNMNNIVTPASSSTGSSGYNANFADSFFNDSEGFSGTNGQAAGDATGNRGNNGGAGGSGSMGLPVNFWLIYDLAGAMPA